MHNDSIQCQDLLKQDQALRDSDTSTLVSALTEPHFDLMTRVKIGELLAAAGDPRILSPEDDGYWTLATREGSHFASIVAWSPRSGDGSSILVMPTIHSGVRRVFSGVIQTVHLE